MSVRAAAAAAANPTSKPQRRVSIGAPLQTARRLHKVLEIGFANMRLHPCADTATNDASMQNVEDVTVPKDAEDVQDQCVQFYTKAPDGDRTEPYKLVIDQQFAKQLWDQGTKMNAKPGINAEIRLVQNVVLNGIMTDVFVKEWHTKPERAVIRNRKELKKLKAKLQEAGPSQKSDWEQKIASAERRIALAENASEESGERRLTLTAVQREVEMHFKTWSKLKPSCRKYLSVPACMTFDIDENANFYTVQSYIKGPPGTRTETAVALCKRQFAKGWIRNTLTVRQRFALVARYAQMLACIHSAGILHNDLHANNVLVVHNLDSVIKLVDGKYSIDFPNLYFQWKVIDWDRAKDVEEDWNMLSLNRTCFGPTYDPHNKYKKNPKNPHQPGIYHIQPQGRGNSQLVKFLCITERSEMSAVLLEMVSDYNGDKALMKEKIEMHEDQLASLKEQGFKEGDPTFELLSAMIDNLKEKDENDKKYYTGEVTQNVVNKWLLEAYAHFTKMPIWDVDVIEDLNRLIADETKYGGTGKAPEIDMDFENMERFGE